MGPKPKNKALKPTSNTNIVKEQLPNWPRLNSLVLTENLYVETLVEDQIVVIRNLLTSKLCKDYVSFLTSLPLMTTPGKPKRGEAVRVNDRYQVTDAGFANILWQETALKQLILNYKNQALWKGDVLGLNSNIRVYRYKPGQFFDQHYDESNKVSFGPDKTPAHTTWTLLIYLTTCQGGETAFYPESMTKGEKSPEPVVVGLETGMALLHKHGDDCMLHEGKEVKSGEKWVLRSDLVVKG